MPTVETLESIDLTPEQLIAEFEHQSLEDYNPDFPAVDDGVYEFKLVGSPRERSGVSEKPDEAGNIVRRPWLRKSMQLAITSEGSNRGRRLWVDEFPGKFTAFAAKVMRATGVSQDTNETVSAYLTKVAGMDARFQASVRKFFNEYRDKDDNEVIISSISSV